MQSFASTSTLIGMLVFYSILLSPFFSKSYMKHLIFQYFDFIFLSQTNDDKNTVLCYYCVY